MSIKTELETARKAAERLQKRLERELIAKYKETNRELKLMFADLYRKYETGGKLTFVEMQKYDRLKAIQKDVTATINELYQKERSYLNTGLKDIYENGYYRTAYAIEKDLQAKLSYSLLNVDKIKAAIQNPISGLTLNETLSKNRINIIGKINQEIVQGLVRGESYGKMAKRITETLGGDAGKAIRVAQTEAHRIHVQATMESAEQAEAAGVNMMKTWVATLDDRTRDAHRDLDGQTIPMDENFTDSTGGDGPGPGAMGTAASDINCRCTLAYEVEGVAHDFRRVRGEGVIPYQTYNEWAAAKEIKVS
jgi:SPP1 gp7 family putative phage head morphogenesis protein